MATDPGAGLRTFAETAVAPDSEAAALAGLDSLELGQAGRRARSVWGALWPKLLAIAIVIGLWELLYLSGWKHDVVPAPATVFSYLWAQLHTAVLWQAIGTTVRRAVLGFGLALVIGVVVGALVSRIRPLRAAVGSLITALQTMPSIAWFPFAIILFGATTQAILFVIILGAAPSVANGLIAGVDYTPPLLLKAGKMLVIILGQPSIGVLLSNYQDQSDTAGAISIMIVILVIGIVVDGIFTRIDLSIRRRRGMLDPAVA